MQNAGQALAQPAGAVRVKGRVKDLQGRDVAYATLVFEPGQITGLSNENGRFEVFLSPGSFTVQVAHLGYRPRRLTWDLAVGT
ncbi:MAG: carboxypeptidase-like regulatory domain-containing protein, partial [Bacteroidota bacterium]